MKKFVVAAAAVVQTLLLSAALSFVFPTGASADECPKAPKSPRQKCLKKTYNYCNPGNGLWDNPANYQVPPGPKDTCPK
jgi:hypothetical protein